MNSGMTTEGVNPASAEIDRLSASQIVRLMNSEDARVAAAVGREEASIAAAIDVIADRLRSGGRLIYLGAGTSGRLGVLDATVPTHVQHAAGNGRGADRGRLRRLCTAAEGVEDHPEIGVEDLKRNEITSADVVVGIATSGRTPYVIGGLRYARSVGAFAIGLACNDGSALAEAADLMITPIVGPEVISGSTRLKAGTATKMVLNMLTTGAMVLLGKTYGNLMVDLRATNTKLVARSRRLVCLLTDVDEAQADERLAECDGELKTTVVSIRRGVSAAEARKMLEAVRRTTSGGSGTTASGVTAAHWTSFRK
ncbi:MAG: N-acetylmuramic acid 6-phosphate etherase [Planctomycetaceae bacterium]